MLFNSIEFGIFLPFVFLLYWLVTNRDLKIQNILLVVASYVFYGWWDWRFLGLIIFSSFIDYSIGLLLAKTQAPTQRKMLLMASLVANLGFLGFFKYFNFFAENFALAFTWLGEPIDIERLNIVLPVGISFYTFQTLSYTIDVYRQKLKPTKGLISFLAFVSFFPQLVAGPIERATHLLPQFYKPRRFDYHRAVDGMRQILWGLFKKIVIADNCAQFANQIFENSADLNGSALILGAVFFTFQIYGDFAGYSDIAIGTARLFGFDLMQNFNFPYFSRNIAEFWRRWHISLNTWFRDYLYIPLGGSRGGIAKKIRNVLIIFLVSGFWHGANWTYIVWGGLNALYFLPVMLSNNNRKYLDVVAQGKHYPSWRELVNMTLTFGATVLAWIFFRAETITHALQYIEGIYSRPIMVVPDFTERRLAFVTLVLVVIFVIIEWIGREQKYAIEKIGLEWTPIYRYIFYYVILLVIYWFGGQEQQFIYFQF